MRWMVIVLLASLAALLLAAAGVARHIWLQRSRLNSSAGPLAGSNTKPSLSRAEETDPEIEL